MESIGVWWLWTIFFLLIACMLGFDVRMGSLHYHKVTLKEALLWATICVFSALIFGLLIWIHGLQVTTPEIANQKTLEFYTGFAIEQSLSVDNLFVFILIFNYFKVDLHYQRRVLMYGIWGAIVLRFIMIMLGILLVQEAHWILYVFGLFLIYSAFKILLQSEEEDLQSNKMLKLVKKYFPVTHEFHGEKFLVRLNGIYHLTPLFLALVIVEVSDLVFALDSIPAVFAITRDPFIVFTSNIFAILGLRAMYFILLDMSGKFHLMKYGIAAVLAIIGAKMLLEPWYKLPTGVSLLLVILILSSSIILSLYIKPHHKPRS